MFAKGRKVCRICEQDVKGSIEEHMLLDHSQDTFAFEGEIEEENINDDKYLVEEDKAVINRVSQICTICQSKTFPSDFLLCICINFNKKIFIALYFG